MLGQQDQGYCLWVFQHLCRLHSHGEIYCNDCYDNIVIKGFVCFITIVASVERFT